MANWYGHARTNYFRVKDETAFVGWAGEFDVEVIRDKEGRVGLLPFNTEDGAFGQSWFDENGDKLDNPRCIEDELGQHLPEGEVALIFTVGAEKLRYLTAYMVAVTSGSVECYDLPRMVAELYPSATLCEC